MLPQTDLTTKTRRAVLKAAGAALGVAAVGKSIAHPGDIGGGNSKFYGGTDGYLGDNRADSAANVDLVGYHSAGGVGPASLSGQPEDAHRGAMSELRIHDDLAFVSMFSGRDDHSQRGLAIFDISDFTRAESESDLDNAELTLLSFVRNDNTQAACMDVKVADDGQYVFVAKQTLTALFGEGHRAQPNGDGHSNAPGAGSLVAVDVSDPGNPQVTSEVELSHWSVGPHNCWYHQIAGSEYVFTVHGTSSAASKTNVFEFDRASGQLYQVNAFSWDTNVATGEYGPESNQWYHHDLQVQEDPRTGVPLLYLHCWNAGLRIYDVSDPTDVSEIGVFEQEGAHHAVPAPTLIDGKRVAVTGNENPDSHYHAHIDNEHSHGETGRYMLVDCDPLDLALLDDEEGGDSDVERVYLGVSSVYRDSDATVTTNPDPTGETDVLESEEPATSDPRTRAPYQMYADDDPAVHVVRDGDGELATELDSWVLIGKDDDGWADAWGFEEEAEKASSDPDEEPGPYDGFTDFRISTHNLDMDTEGRLYAGHYHAGMRAFQIDADDGTIEETAYYRRGKDIPTEAAMAFTEPTDEVSGLTASTPFFWNAVERNGVVFSSGINGGPHVMRETHDGAADVGSDTPIDVDIEREEDVPLTVSNQALRVTITADSDEDLVLRDAIPNDWTVLEEYSPDLDHVHEIDGYRTIVSLRPDDSGRAVYLVEAPADFSSATFGPVEYARADENGDPAVDSHWGGGNSTTNRLWRKDNAAVSSVGTLGI